MRYNAKYKMYIISNKQNNLEIFLLVYNFKSPYGYTMFSVKKDLSFKLNRDHSRYDYCKNHPILYVNKLGLFDFFKIPVEVINISKSGLLAKVRNKGKFVAGDKIIIEFDNYFTDVIPTKVMRWEPDTQLLAVKFSREIKLVERIALNIA